MNAKDQRKLCKAGYTILRRHDYPQPHITFKSDINPDSWKVWGQLSFKSGKRPGNETFANR